MKSFKQLRTEAKEVWDKPNPKAERGESEKLSSSAKARARARAKAAGRPYPNMVDNIWAARSEETVLESGGDKIFKNANGHIEKYGDNSYAVYRNGQKQTFYTTLDAAKAALSEATYQGRDVPLNKPMAGDVKKSKVFVDPDGDGKAKKVNFGDKNLSIKKHIPARRKSFRARHNCDEPGPKDKARYWSCKAW